MNEELKPFKAIFKVCHEVFHKAFDTYEEAKEFSLNASRKVGLVRLRKRNPNKSTKWETFESYYKGAKYEQKFI